VIGILITFFVRTDLCEWTTNLIRRGMYGRQVRHNPRPTTSTTCFIVAPMYLLIKHRIDLSAVPGTGARFPAKYPYHRRRSTSQRLPHLHSAARSMRCASENPFICCVVNYSVTELSVYEDIKYRALSYCYGSDYTAHDNIARYLFNRDIDVIDR